MFTIDNKYKVFFIHKKFEGEDKFLLSFIYGISASHATLCEIKDTVLDTVVGEGMSICSTSDNFSRAEGRKRSLTRALTDSRFDKSIRTKFWTKYWSMVKS